MTIYVVIWVAARWLAFCEMVDGPWMMEMYLPHDEGDPPAPETVEQLIPVVDAWIAEKEKP